MIEEVSNKDWGFACLTFKTGTRTFQGLEMLLESVKDHFKDITSHSDGSFSDTNDLIARNSFSDIAIIMSYALIEGFFYEEYDYYIEKKPRSLVDTIKDLTEKHCISLENWEHRSQKIDAVRKLRNAAVHGNGKKPSNIDSKECEKLFGEDIFQASNHYPQMSLECALSLISDFRQIAEEYACAVFKQSNKR